jgi:pyruvate formate lyase activating enzyme
VDLKGCRILLKKIWILQVCVLDYRPAFRRLDILRPEYEEMVNVWKILSGTGLKTIICQTAKGHIGPEL